MLNPTPYYQKARFWMALGMLNAAFLAPLIALLG